jgi:hypothetical protein
MTEKENALMRTPRAERGVARHYESTGWKPASPSNPYNSVQWDKHPACQAFGC